MLVKAMVFMQIAFTLLPEMMSVKFYVNYEWTPIPFNSSLGAAHFGNVPFPHSYGQLDNKTTITKKLAVQVWYKLHKIKNKN